MCLAQDGLREFEARAKSLSLLKAQLERWRNALPIHSPGKRKTDIELLRAYFSCAMTPQVQRKSPAPRH